jgi:DNA-binding CsgD family transcriptional regulator
MSSGLVGRAREVHELTSALSAPARAVVVYGEAGVGKTAVIRSGVPAGARREGGALATLSWLRHLPLRRAFDGAVPEEVWSGDPAHVAAAVEEAVADDVLVVDDLQWADPDTLTVVETLAARIPLVAGVRRGDPNGVATLDRLTKAGFRRVDVEPLPARDAAELVRRLRPELSHEEAESVVARSGGNPLMIEELAISEPGADTLRMALLSRIRPLTEDAREGIALLAVANLALPGAEVPGIGELVESGLVIDEGSQVRIRHALIGEVVAELASPERRERCHRFLAASSPLAAERARHLIAFGDLAGAHVEAMAAVEASVNPGERAVHLVTAASCVEGEAAHALLLRAARAANDAADSSSALELLARLPATPEIRSPALVEEARAWFDLGDDDQWTRCVTEGLELAAPGTPEAFAFRTEEIAVALFVQGDVARAAALATALLAEADRDGIACAAAHRLLGGARLTAGDPSGVDITAAAVARARREEDVFALFAATNNLISGHEQMGDPRVAVELARQARDEAERARFTRWSRHFHAMALNLAMHAGDHATVLHEAPTLLGQPLMPRTREEVAAALAICQLDSGLIAESLATCEAHLRDASIRTANYHLIRAMALLANARPVDALAEREPFLATEPIDSLRLLIDPTFAWAAWDAGVPAPEPHPGDKPGMLAGVRREMGGLKAMQDGDFEEAARCFLAAADLFAPYHRRGELRTRWGRAEALRLAGRDSEARAALVELEDVAAAGGWLPILRRTRRSLRALGVGRRELVEAGARTGLTGREEQVVDLAGDGLSDHEIASRLGVSPRTVQSQLGSARRKLGASNRRQAAELLARRRSR